MLETQNGVIHGPVSVKPTTGQANQLSKKVNTTRLSNSTLENDLYLNNTEDYHQFAGTIMQSTGICGYKEENSLRIFPVFVT